MPKAATWARTPPEGFPPDQSRGVRMGLEILRGKMPVIMENTKQFLVAVTPSYSGGMRRRVAAWGLRSFGAGGFGFFYGWRKKDFLVFYPEYVLGGTGVWGSHTQWIRPVHAPVLVWENKHYGKRVALAVVGQPPQDLFGKCSDKVSTNLRVEMMSAFKSGTETMKYAPRAKKVGGWF